MLSFRADQRPDPKFRPVLEAHLAHQFWSGLRTSLVQTVAGFLQHLLSLALVPA